MRTALAEKLLIKLMDWDTKQIRDERPLLQALSNFKYDEYQQFTLGTRFIESLVKWLGQFQNIDERKVAYEFIKKHLIFISNDQMLHLVNMTFADKINPHLLKKTATRLGVKPYKVQAIVKADEYKKNLRKSLFIGLSDGARIDQLRRSCHLNNEQVIPMYSISEDKGKDILKELTKEGYEGKFDSIFLVDDFTASGTSYFRKEEGEWKGKVYKTLDSLLSANGSLNKLIPANCPIEVHIVFYIATAEALGKLKNNIDEWLKENPCQMNYSIETVQCIGSDVRDNLMTETGFLNLAKNYFDESIINGHWKKGKYDEPYLGFNECALPLILVHNTPNNSLPLLWFPEDKKHRGLFPRISRHKG